MPRKLDLTGQRFGRLVAMVSENRRFRTGVSQVYWRCLCDCGNETVVQSRHLRTGATQSCGCLQHDLVTTHGQASRGKRAPEYQAYSQAKSRCTNLKHPQFRNYGGRGIKFLFNSFEEFFAEVGPRTGPSYSIDRINNNGHYGKGNLRWATSKEQSANQRPRARKPKLAPPRLQINLAA